jgi:hypothetical protein
MESPLIVRRTRGAHRPEHFSGFDFMNIRIVSVFHAAHGCGFESLPIGCQFFDAFTICLLGV